MVVLLIGASVSSLAEYTYDQCALNARRRHRRWTGGEKEIVMPDDKGLFLLDGNPPEEPGLIADQDKNFAEIMKRQLY